MIISSHAVTVRIDEDIITNNNSWRADRILLLIMLILVDNHSLQCELHHIYLSECTLWARLLPVQCCSVTYQLVKQSQMLICNHSFISATAATVKYFNWWILLKRLFIWSAVNSRNLYCELVINTYPTDRTQYNCRHEVVHQVTVIQHLQGTLHAEVARQTFVPCPWIMPSACLKYQNRTCR